MPPIDIARRTLNRVLRLPKLLLTCVVVVLFAALSAPLYLPALRDAFWSVFFLDTSRTQLLYRGLNLTGEWEGLGWSYNAIDVTSPRETELCVKLGAQPMVPVKDLGTEMVRNYMIESGRTPRFVIVDANHPSYIGGGEVRFRDGSPKYATFSSHCPNALFSYRGQKFRLPLSKRDVDRIFGEPLDTRKYSRGA
jgi:hypothetical protein